jgi:hypothetical protein
MFADAALYVLIYDYLLSRGFIGVSQQPKSHSH